MATIAVRELARNAKEVFDELEQGGTPLVITRNGRPVAALVSIDQQEAETCLIASAPDLIENRKSAEAAVRAGRTIPPADALLEVGGETLESATGGAGTGGRRGQTPGIGIGLVPRMAGVGAARWRKPGGGGCRGG